METKHTPGTWLIVNTTIYSLMHHEWRKGIEQFKNRFSFNFQFDKDVSEDEKESTILMTMAAPDLLECLQLISDLASMEWQESDGRRCGAKDNQGRSMFFISADLMNEARSAIAKATGN